MTQEAREVPTDESQTRLDEVNEPIDTTDEDRIDETLETEEPAGDDESVNVTEEQVEETEQDAAESDEANPELLEEAFAEDPPRAPDEDEEFDELETDEADSAEEPSEDTEAETEGAEQDTIETDAADVETPEEESEEGEPADTANGEEESAVAEESQDESPEAKDEASEEASGTEESEEAKTPTVESVVEAILFATDEPLTDGRLAKIVETTGTQVRKCIAALNEKYEQNHNAFRIEQIAGGYQMLTLETYNTWLRKMLRVRSDNKLSPAAMETLAIIAYKQPVIRVDIEAIRGVAVGEVIRSLMYKGLVKIVGRAEILGRPMLYGTTKKFLEVFGLNSLKDLPKVEELKKPD